MIRKTLLSHWIKFSKETHQHLRIKKFTLKEQKKTILELHKDLYNLSNKQDNRLPLVKEFSVFLPIFPFSHFSNKSYVV